MPVWIGREHGYVVVVGNVESAMLRHLCAQRAGVGHGLRETVSVAVRQIELGALGGQPHAVARPMPLAAPVTKHRFPS